MTENEIGKIVIDSAFRVHQEIGPGLLETVYEIALAHEIKKRGLSVERQVPISIQYDNLVFDEGFRADLIVEDLVLVEVKSQEKDHPVHKKQLLTYLSSTVLDLSFFDIQRHKSVTFFPVIGTSEFVAL